MRAPGLSSIGVAPCDARLVRIAHVLSLSAALVLSGCCFTGGWHECDSSTHVGGCRGNHLEYCSRTGGSWSGEYEELIEYDCAADEVCIEPTPGQPACVLAPATQCDSSTAVGRCDGNIPVYCGAPNSWITDDYLIHLQECTNGWTCRVEEGHAGCMPP